MLYCTPCCSIVLLEAPAVASTYARVDAEMLGVCLVLKLVASPIRPIAARRAPSDAVTRHNAEAASATLIVVTRLRYVYDRGLENKNTENELPDHNLKMNLNYHDGRGNDEISDTFSMLNRMCVIASWYRLRSHSCRRFSYPVF